MTIDKPGLRRLLAMRPHFLSASTIDVSPELLAALCWRETRALDRWCMPPPIGQLGDHGHGHGPLQIDDRWHAAFCSRWRAGELTVADGLRYGASVMQSMIFLVRRKSASHLAIATDARKIAIAAYNAGPGPAWRAYVTTGDPDTATTGCDYAQSVLRYESQLIACQLLK